MGSACSTLESAEGSLTSIKSGNMHGRQSIRTSFNSLKKLGETNSLKDGREYGQNYDIGEAVGPDDGVFSAVCKDNDVEYVSRALEKDTDLRILVNAIWVPAPWLDTTTADMPIKNTSDLQDHLQVLAGLDHSHICRFIEAYDNNERVQLIYEKAKPVSIFDEEAELRNGKPLSQETAQVYCRHIAAALRVAHKQGLAHGRLNQACLLVDQNHEEDDGPRSVKICDMGQTWILRKARTGCAVDFEAPETLWDDVPSSNSVMHFRAQMRSYQSVDMWSFGVIIYKMLTGKMPFFKAGGDMEEAIKEHLVEFGPDWKRMPDAKDLVSSLLKKEGRIRISAEKVLKHPWISHCKEKVSKSKMVRVLQNVIFNTTESTFKKFCMRVIAEDMPPEKVEVVTKAFRLIDTNGDGNLEVNEIALALKKFGEEEGLATEIFEAIDRDASGTLNFAEFTAVSIGPSEYCDKEILWHCFNRFDKDGNGAFDRDEIGTVVREVENLTESVALEAEVEEIASDVQMPMDFDTFVAHMITPMGSPISNLSLGLNRFCSNVFKVDMHGVRHITPKTYDHSGPNVLKKSVYAKSRVPESPSKSKKKQQKFQDEEE